MAKKTQKTHSGVKKVLKVRPGGTITFSKPGASHKTGKKNAAYSRDKRQAGTLDSSDRKRLKRVIETL